MVCLHYNHVCSQADKRDCLSRLGTGYEVSHQMFFVSISCVLLDGGTLELLRIGGKSEILRILIFARRSSGWNGVSGGHGLIKGS